MNNPLKVIIKKSNTLLQKLSYTVDYRINNPVRRLLNDYQNLFRRNGMNICFNSLIPRVYDPDKKNILIAIESPAVVEYNKWLNPDMKFIAEISLGNFYNLENYFCPRELYASNDFYVNLNVSKEYNKNKLISIIYSASKRLKGHKLRSDVANRFKDQIDIFGSGTNISIGKEKGDYYYPHSKYIRKRYSLEDYMFQIVIENGKYPDYVSEKFYDCLKTRTIPIYWGGQQSVKKMGFNTEGIFFFDSIIDLEKILTEEVSESNYRKKTAAIEFNLNRLIEIRNNQKFNYFLNTVMSSYLHSTESYHNRNYSRMALNFDSKYNK